MPKGRPAVAVVVNLCVGHPPTQETPPDFRPGCVFGGDVVLLGALYANVMYHVGINCYSKKHGLFPLPLPFPTASGTTKSGVGMARTSRKCGRAEPRVWKT